MGETGTNLMYRRLLTQDEDELRKFLLSVYFKQTPTFSSLEFEEGELNVDEYLKVCLDHDLSYGTFDGNVMVACLTAVAHSSDSWNSATNKFDHENVTSEKMAKIRQLKELVHEGKDLFHLYDVDSIVEISRLAVLPEYQRRGIANELVRLVESAVTEAGYKAVFTRTSSIYSNYMFEKLQYERLSEVFFDEFLDEDNSPIIPVSKPHISYTLLAKSIR